MPDNQNIFHTQEGEILVYERCFDLHLTSCRNVLSGHSDFYWKEVGNAAWGCFFPSELDSATSWGIALNKAINMLNRHSFIQDTECNRSGSNYGKTERREIAPDLWLLCRNRSGDFVVHHKAIYLQLSTCGCVNILHERGSCHQSTALHQKQPFLVRG